MDDRGGDREEDRGAPLDLPAHIGERLVEMGADPRATPAVVLLSGGGDSTALLIGMCERAERGEIRALHVNYRLRGRQSEADEAFCRDLCAGLDVPLEVVVAPDHDGGNLQDWARSLRYAAAEETAARIGPACVIAVAHNADDQAETVLYRLFASPGRRALRGVPERRGRIVRPLLGLRRAELRRWLAARGERWREDASNEDERFARVRARRLLADAEGLHPTAVANLLRTADELRREGDELSEVVEGLVVDLTLEDDALDLDALADLPPALGGAVLRSYVEHRRPVPVPKAATALPEALRLGGRSEPSELQVEGARIAIQRGRARVLDSS